MKKFLNYLAGIVLLLFLIMVYPAETGSTQEAPSASPYVEVCSRGIVYLPAGTRFVTCHGRIMEVIAIVPLAEGAGAQKASGCHCPNCCGGVCTVIVRCTDAPEAASESNECPSESNSASGGGGLCTVYLAC